MALEIESLIKTSGGLIRAIEDLTVLSRALWRLLLTEEVELSQLKPRDPYRYVRVELLMKKWLEISNGTTETISKILGCMETLKLCWIESGVITYRRSVLNPLSLCRQVLASVRPEHDIRYFLWKSVRSYYDLGQSAGVAHYIHALSDAVNELIRVRKETTNPAGVLNAGRSWSTHEEVLPQLLRRLNKNFAIPLQISELFLECCRIVNYVQVSDRTGRLDIQAQEVDPEYLLCQLFGVPTAIKGLDELFGGGGLMLTESVVNSSTRQIGGRAVLTVGPFGSGKSLLALQVAAEVARKGGVAWLMPMEQTAEECLYSLESMGCLPDDVPIRIADCVPRAIELLENPDPEKGALILIRTVKETFDDFMVAFEDNASLMGRYPLRLLIVDPISAISQESSKADVRGKMLRLFESVKQSGTNIWLVAEEGTGHGVLLEQNIADTVIHVFQEQRHGYSQRYIEIRKSRLQREQRGLHAFSIGPGRGLTIYPSSAAVRSRLQKRRVRIPNMPITFGISAVDFALQGSNLFSGDVIAIQGDSGSGKTALSLAFLMGADLQQARHSGTALFVTNVDAEVSVRHQLMTVYDSLRKDVDFAVNPDHIRVINLPGGYVQPGYILQRIENEFELMRLRGTPIARVVVDNIAHMDMGCPFVTADQTFGDTLVELLRKHQVTSLFVCSSRLMSGRDAIQHSILNNADCKMYITRSSEDAAIEIRKSRGMRHSRDPVPLKLSVIGTGAP
jgi:KaiC/GvpD/RAD55 family RecA-like ATPase